MLKTETIEDSTQKLINWLRPKYLGKRSVFISPGEVQTELGISPPVFWYCLFILKERQMIGFQEVKCIGLHPAQMLIEDGDV